MEGWIPAFLAGQVRGLKAYGKASGDLVSAGTPPDFFISSQQPRNQKPRPLAASAEQPSQKGLKSSHSLRLSDTEVIRQLRAGETAREALRVKRQDRFGAFLPLGNQPFLYAAVASL